MEVQNEVRDKRKQIHGYVNANARLMTELDARDAQVGVLSERLQGYNQPATPAKTLGTVLSSKSLRVCSGFSREAACLCMPQKFLPVGHPRAVTVDRR